MALFVVRRRKQLSAMKDNGKDIEKLRSEILKTINRFGATNQVALGTLTELTVDMWMFCTCQDKSHAMDGLSRSVNTVMLGKYKK